MLKAANQLESELIKPNQNPCDSHDGKERKDPCRSQAQKETDLYVVKSGDTAVWTIREGQSAGGGD